MDFADKKSKKNSITGGEGREDGGRVEAGGWG